MLSPLWWLTFVMRHKLLSVLGESVQNRNLWCMLLHILSHTLWHSTCTSSQLMANRQISGQPLGSWLTFQTLQVYYSHCQCATCHCLMSTLILKPATVQQPHRQRASWRLEGRESRTRRLCCDHECVWHYVNSAYLVLIASAARMSILKLKETIYHFPQATMNKTGSGFWQNC